MQEVCWDLPPGAVLLAKVVPEGDAQAGSSSVTEGAWWHVALIWLLCNLLMLFAGWIFKSDPKGRNFKRRWVVVDPSTQSMAYYANNPRTTLAKFQVTEQPKGSFDLRNANVNVLPSAPSGAPEKHCLQLFLGAKAPVFACKKEDSRAKWMEVIQYAISGAGLSSTGGGNGITDAMSIQPCEPSDWEGWIFKTDPEGRTWTKRYGHLDCQNFFFSYYTDNTRSVAKGSIDLRGAAVHLGVGPSVAAMMGDTTARDTPAFHIITNNANGRGRTYAVRVGGLAQLQSVVDRVAGTIAAASKGKRSSLPSSGNAGSTGGVVNGNPLHTSDGATAAVRAARGWLYKSNPKGQYWKRRWSEIVVSPPDPAHGICLKYFSDSPSNGGKLKGAMVLRGGRVELVERSGASEVKGAPTVFTLVVRTPERNWWLAAENNTDRTSWYMALKSAVAAANV